MQLVLIFYSYSPCLCQMEFLSGNGLLHFVSGCSGQPNCLFSNKASYIFIYGTRLCPLHSDLYWLLPEKNQEAIQHSGKYFLGQPFPNISIQKVCCFLLEPRHSTYCSFLQLQCFVFSKITPSLMSLDSIEIATSFCKIKMKVYETLRYIDG